MGNRPPASPEAPARTGAILESSRRNHRLATLAAAAVLLGLLGNDWLPTGVFTQIGSPGNAARAWLVRSVSMVLVASGAAALVAPSWAARSLPPAGLFAALVGLCLAIVVPVDAWLVHQRLGNSVPNPLVGTLHVQHPVRGWTLKAGARARHVREGSFDVEYEIDERGFKAVDRHGEPRSRLFLFGDSYTFGHGVPNRDTFANILALELRQDVHVFNTGVMGYGIEQMYSRFLDLESELGPADLVVFTPTSQDLKRNFKDFYSHHWVFLTATYVERYPFYRDGELTSIDARDPWLRFKALFFYGFSRSVVRFFYHVWTSPDTTSECVEMITDIRARSEARGARFALFFLPQTKERRRGRYEEDISYFDYFDVMEYFPEDRRALESLEIPGSDTHWSRAGHEIAARAIVETLLEREILRPDELRDPDAWRQRATRREGEARRPGLPRRTPDPSWLDGPGPTRGSPRSRGRAARGAGPRRPAPDASRPGT